VPTVSIGARGDLVVPSPRTHLPGATNVVVHVEGLALDHDRLPGSPAAFRETALALAGQPPTCTGLLDAVVDAATGVTVIGAERVAGTAVAVPWREPRGREGGGSAGRSSGPGPAGRAGKHQWWPR
jgi:hypothetical protein